MTQENIDILCVNTQTELGLQGVVLVRLIKNGDISAQAYGANHMALHSHMRANMGSHISLLETFLTNSFIKRKKTSYA